MDWHDVILGDLIEIKHGFAFKSEFFSDEGNYILLTPGNCRASGGLKFKGTREKFYIGDFPKEYLLFAGDLLVIMTDLVNNAPILGGALIIPEDERFLHNQRLGLIRVAEPDRIDKKFLYYLLNTEIYRSQVRGSASGATVRHTSPSRIKQCKMKIPDTVVAQRRIASILSAYDDLFENNRRRIALLERAARLLYREWFVHLRFPGHEHITIINGVPVGWEKKAAYDMMNIHSGGTPKTTISDYWNGDIPLFTPKDTTDHIYTFNTEKRLTELGLKNCNSKLYPKDTVFITARGTVGKVNLAHTNMAINQSCYALIAQPPITQHFLYFALVESVKQIQGHAVGSVFDAVVRDTFKLIPFLIPNHEIVQLFSEHIALQIRQIEILITESRKLAQARDLLLPCLMNGEITV